MISQAQTPIDKFNEIWRKIPATTKITFLSAFLIGVFTHLFIFTNMLPNLDAVNVFVVRYEITWPPLWVNDGRWLSFYILLLTGRFSLPFVNEILSLVLISISACLIVSITKVKKSIYCILISSLLVTIPVVASIFTYMQLSVPFFFGLLTSCLAAFIAERYNKYGFIFSAILVLLSLSIYQAYFSVTVALFIIAVILEILDNRESWQKIIIKGIKYVAALGVGMLLYLISVNVIYPDGLTPYQGLDKMGSIPISDIPYLIRRAYVEIIRVFISDSRNFHYAFMRYMFILAFAACGILVFLWCVKPGAHLSKSIIKQPIKIFLLLVLFVLFPLGINLIYVMTPFSSVHDLMIYPTVFIPIFLLIVADRYSDNEPYRDESINEGFLYRLLNKRVITKTVNASVWVITLVAVILSFNYWIVSNQAYFKLKIAYETTYAQSVLLVSQIQNVEGYRADMDVILVGLPHIPQGIPELSNITNTGATGPELFGNWSYMFFLRNYLNFTQVKLHLLTGLYRNEYHEAVNFSFIVRGMPVYDLNIAEYVRRLPIYYDVELMETIRKMPMFPNSGSIAIIDDIIYVRFTYVDRCCWEFFPNQIPTCCIR